MIHQQEKIITTFKEAQMNKCEQCPNQLHTPQDKTIRQCRICATLLKVKQ